MSAPSTAARTGSKLRVSLVLAGLSCFLAGSAAAQRAPMPPEVDPERPELAVLANTRWALVLPERDYEGGCAVGYMAFQFMSSGYFLFNNRTSGSWRMDELGNVKLSIRGGPRVTLVIQGDQMRALSSSTFGGRTHVYQRCPEE